MEASETNKILDALDAHGDRNVFLGGPGGTGKSYIIREYVKLHRPHTIAVTASTGIAASNINGVTIHSWAMIGLGGKPARAYTRKYGEILLASIKDCTTLIIDEISMISHDVFELVSDVLKGAKNNKLPFGGLRLIISGDFYQLPPVSLSDCVTYAFESKTWRELNLKHIECTYPYRYIEDVTWFKCLTRLRTGNYCDLDKELLDSRINETYNNSENNDYVEIYAVNSDVNRKNTIELEKLPLPEIIYKCRDDTFTPELERLHKHIPKELALRVGSKVILTVNICVQDKLVNGTQGEVVELHSNYVKIKLAGTDKTSDIVYHKFECEIIEPFGVKIKQRTQIPLLLAWAFTAHKCQGMSFDRIIPDINRSFADGQAYTMVSRCRTLNGVIIKNRKINMARFIPNKKVKKFYDSILCADE